MKKRVGELKKIYLLPNLVTTCCLFAGSFSIMQSLDGDFTAAAWAILIASVFDSLDGRLARLTGSESSFGVQYDSLSDLTSFGVAPAILVYSWTLQNFSRLGIAVAFLYVACAALRLARYNVQISRVEKSSFQGLPVPAAACMLGTMVIFYNHIYGPIRVESYLCMAVTFILAALMVSSFRYPSFKGIDFRSRRSFHYLVWGVGLIVVIALEPRITLFLLAVIYVAYGLFERVIFMHRKSMARQAVEVATRAKKKSGNVQVLQINREVNSKVDSNEQP